MSVVEIDIPTEVLMSLKQGPDTIGRELTLASAAKLYELGKLSSGRAAQLAGMPRAAFLQALSQFRVSPIGVTPTQLGQDVENA